MGIIIRNKNFKSARQLELEGEAQKIADYFSANTTVEQLTKTQLLSAIPSISSLLPLSDGEIHFMCDFANVEFIQT